MPTDTPKVINMKLDPSDYQEALDGSGCTTSSSALMTCLRISKVTWVIEEGSGPDKSIIGVFGLGSREGQVHPWLLGSPSLHQQHALTLCRGGRKVVADWKQRFPYMLNVVWEKNERAIKWLKWLGFRFPEGEQMKVNGNIYLKFEMHGGPPDV